LGGQSLSVQTKKTGEAMEFVRGILMEHQCGLTTRASLAAALLFVSTT